MRLGRSGAGRDPTDTSYHWWESTRAEQDHHDLPVPYRWRVAGTIIGVIVVTFVVTIVLAVDDSEPIEYRAIVPTAIDTDPDADPSITTVEIEVEAANPEAGRVRVRGADIVRVDIQGTALCDPVSGTDNAWLAIDLCAPLDTLQITAQNEDDESTTAVARF